MIICGGSVLCDSAEGGEAARHLRFRFMSSWGISQATAIHASRLRPGVWISSIRSRPCSRPPPRPGPGRARSWPDLSRPAGQASIALSAAGRSPSLAWRLAAWPTASAMRAAPDDTPSLSVLRTGPDVVETLRQ